MTIRVMLVDDSAVIRSFMARALTATPGVEIIAHAGNGVEAIEKAAALIPDIIILDIEMPEMDGITALPKLLKASPASKIIMASAFTMHNAEISIRAIALGASDYIAKPPARYPDMRKVFDAELRQKVEVWAASSRSRAAVKTKTAASSASVPALTIGPRPPSHVPVKALAIASSTGGPQALLKLFGDLKGKLTQLPIFIAQHMPATFTTVLAEHLSKAGARPCSEAKNGEEVKAGHVYLAPGDFHMLATAEGGKIVMYLNQSPPVNFCRPAADPLLQSLSTVYGQNLLVAVLTGMGQDGLEGARKVVAAGGSVIAQDEATSAVWGMPKAVATNNLCRAVLPLPEISGYLLRHVT